MKILQYVCLHIKNSITQILDYNTILFLRYAKLDVGNFVYKYIETTEYVKKQPTFSEK